MLFEEIYVGVTEKKGRGMFAHVAIPAETIVELAPVIVMSEQDRIHLDKTLLHDYIFEWQPNGEKLCCMALGNIPIYNHSYDSNCEYFMDYENNNMYIKTIKPIEAGEELTINYNGDFDDKKPVWFDVKP